ncbi:hypothetical protein BS78_04G142500 [Paspalum vaginatum]|nr:hypothetical protein BS78_04G142500 [Paspalum vaginatum]
MPARSSPSFLTAAEEEDVAATVAVTTAVTHGVAIATAATRGVTAATGRGVAIATAATEIASCCMLLAVPQDEIDARYKHALYLATKYRPVVANDIRDETDSFKKDAGYYRAEAAAASGRRDYLNNTYYHNALDNRVLFKSDWALRTDSFAMGKLKEYRDKPREWDADFADTLVKLSRLPAEGKNFEIRKKYRATNKQNYY